MDRFNNICEKNNFGNLEVEKNELGKSKNNINYKLNI